MRRGRPQSPPYNAGTELSDPLLGESDATTPNSASSSSSSSSSAASAASSLFASHTHPHPNRSTSTTTSSTGWGSGGQDASGRTTIADAARERSWNYEKNYLDRKSDAAPLAPTVIVATEEQHEQEQQQQQQQEQQQQQQQQQQQVADTADSGSEEVASPKALADIQGSDSLDLGDEPLERPGWLHKSLSSKLSLVRRQVGDDLRASALRRAAAKSWSARAAGCISRFLRRYEYGVVVCLALSMLIVYSAFMGRVYDQIYNRTGGSFDSLQLMDNAPLAGAGAALFFLTVIVCYMTLRLMYSMSGESVGLLQSAQIYFITIMYFSCIYLFVYCTVEESFQMDPVLQASLKDFADCGQSNLPDPIPGYPKCPALNRMLRMNVLWFYFAATTQTSVGFGDISPSSPISQVASDIQMLLGMVYSVYILGQTVRRITNAESSQKYKRKPKTRCGRFVSRVTHNPCVTMTRRLLRRYIFVVSLALQVILFLTIYFSGSDSFFQNNKNVPVDQAVLIIVFNIVQLMFIVLTTTKFVRKTDELYMNFLLQSFGAVCLTMASVYVAIHSLMFVDQPFKIDISKGNGQRKEFMVIVLQFFHFSLCLMTTIGYGDIYPVKWYSRLVVTAHMLLSVLYMEVMFGLGLQLVKIDGLVDLEDGEEGDDAIEQSEMMDDRDPAADGAGSQGGRPDTILAGGDTDPLDDDDGLHDRRHISGGSALSEPLQPGGLVDSDSSASGYRSDSTDGSHGSIGSGRTPIFGRDDSVGVPNAAETPAAARPEVIASASAAGPKGFDYLAYRRQRWTTSGRPPMGQGSGLRRRRRMSTAASDGPGHITVREIFTQEKQLHALNRRQEILYELLRREGKVSAAVTGLLKPRSQPRRRPRFTAPASARPLTRSTSAQQLSGTNLVSAAAAAAAAAVGVYSGSAREGGGSGGGGGGSAPSQRAASEGNRYRSTSGNARVATRLFTGEESSADTKNDVGDRGGSNNV